jgi:uncharacterized protein YigE (DUF2233 family)
MLKRGSKFMLVAALSVLLTVVFVFGEKKQVEDDRFISYTVDCKEQSLAMYLKNDEGKNFASIANLQSSLEKTHRKLLFAMNGGMYGPDHLPKGVYIENGDMKAPLDTSSGEGNFYIKPNGVFYIAKNNTPGICDTKNFKDNGKIKYATQSGPMLVIDGQIGPAFKQGSANLNVRNGVGVMPNDKVVFLISKVPVNFYDLANYFKLIGCKNALYLDGFVSRAYIPDKNWVQTDGDFGVIIGVTAK